MGGGGIGDDDGFKTGVDSLLAGDDGDALIGAIGRSEQVVSDGVNSNAVSCGAADKGKDIFSQTCKNDAMDPVVS